MPATPIAVKHLAPGAVTLRELLGGEPTRIMRDEVSVLLLLKMKSNPDSGTRPMTNTRNGCQES